MRSRGFDFQGHTFVLRRGVFDPVRHLSGIAFAEQLSAGLAEVAPKASTALDLGTGSGLLAATLARRGLSVIATDISQAAVMCASRNCRDLDVDVRHGDMFAPVAGERFDLVVVNPPYERDRPTRRRSEAFTSADFLEKLRNVHQFGSIAVVGYPADDAATLNATGLDLELWRTVSTSGRDLGLFVSSAKGSW